LAQRGSAAAALVLVVMSTPGALATLPPSPAFGSPQVTVGLNPWNAAVADLDGDGYADVATADAGSGGVSVVRGTGSGLFRPPAHIATGDQPRGIAAADLDGDGAPDLFLTGAAAPNVFVLRNSGIGRFGLGDVSPPVIQLVGDASVKVKAASTYTDAGATAADDVSGDVTASIVVKNSVNTAIIGVYYVSYDVADRAGNNAVTVVRTVNVEPATEGGGGGGSIDLGVLAMLAVLLMARRHARQSHPRPADGRYVVGPPVTRGSEGRR